MCKRAEVNSRCKCRGEYNKFSVSMSLCNVSCSQVAGKTVLLYIPSEALHFTPAEQIIQLRLINTVLKLSQNLLGSRDVHYDALPTRQHIVKTCANVCACRSAIQRSREPARYIMQRRMISFPPYTRHRSV